MTFQKGDCVMILDPDSFYTGRLAIVANISIIAGKEIVTVEIPTTTGGTISFACTAEELL